MPEGCYIFRIVSPSPHRFQGGEAEEDIQDPSHRNQQAAVPLGEATEPISHNNEVEDQQMPPASSGKRYAGLFMRTPPNTLQGFRHLGRLSDLLWIAPLLFSRTSSVVWADDSSLVAKDATSGTKKEEEEGEEGGGKVKGEV